MAANTVINIYIMLVQGCDWTEQTTHEDLEALKDSKAKGLLQNLHEYLYQLSQPETLRDLEAILACEDGPPTTRRLPAVSYITVFKAMLVLLHPNGRFPGPHVMKESLVWQACRILLRRPKELFPLLYRLEYQMIPPET